MHCYWLSRVFVACNVFRLYGIGNLTSNPLSLEAAVDAVSKILNGAVKPVLIAGPKLRVSKAIEAFEELATASGYAVAVMPSAKGFFLETHPNFIGTYWGAVSSEYTSEIVESADKYLFAGPIFNDYRSVEVDDTLRALEVSPQDCCKFPLYIEVEKWR